MKLDSIYADYFPEYSNYFKKYLILSKSMYGMNNSGKLFADELTEWLLDSGFIEYQCQMSIYYKYAPDEKNRLFYLMLMTLYICILLKLLEMVCGCYRKEIMCEIIGISTLVHVN